MAPGLKLRAIARAVLAADLTFNIEDLGATRGEMLLALVIRNAAVVPPAGWTAVETGLGGSGLFADLYARVVELDEPSTAVFVGGAEEIQGVVLVAPNGTPAFVREGSAHVGFAADATPNTPAVDSKQAINIILGAWSASSAVDLEAPSGYTTLDSFTSAIVAPRSLLVAYKVVNATGAAIAQPAAAAGAAVTGRAFAFVLRDSLPFQPQALEDPVPGCIGLFGKDTRAGR